DSIRGGKILIYDDFMFRINRKGTQKLFWKCTKLNCKASIITMNGTAQNIKNVHNHEPQTNEKTRKVFYNQLKKRSIDEPTLPVPQIYRQELANFAVSEEVASCLPDEKLAHYSMYKAIATVRPPLPKTLYDIKLEGQWTETRNGKSFLLFDVLENGNRVMVQELGLVKNYVNSEETRTWICRIIALPLVPMDEVSEAFLLLLEDAPQQTRAKYV
ncbi:uncharacterized protein LOC129229686, partial [Uloborus diversus]|uniref:uncharacterized protein LOC129229686 n=1 Tax=Uloborus diversus TaxID=327109 RepID=UPI00240A2007